MHEKIVLGCFILKIMLFILTIFVETHRENNGVPSFKTFSESFLKKHFLEINVSSISPMRLTICTHTKTLKALDHCNMFSWFLFY